jgi:hypothetical protein
MIHTKKQYDYLTGVRFLLKGTGPIRPAGSFRVATFLLWISPKQLCFSLNKWARYGPIMEMKKDKVSKLLWTCTRYHDPEL